MVILISNYLDELLASDNCKLNVCIVFTELILN